MKIPIIRYFKLFKKYLNQQIKQLILLTILLLLTVGVSLVNPQILSRFIDMAVAKSPAKSLTMMAAIFIGLAIFQQFLLIWSTYLSQNIGWIATNALREDLITHCMHLDMTFHKSHKPGELIERLDGDVTSLFNFFAKLFLNFLNNVALLIGIIVLLFMKDYRVGIGILLFSIVAMVVLTLFQKIAVPRWINDRQKSAEFYGFIGEQITSIEDIKSSGAISYVMYRFYQFIKGWFKVRNKALMTYGYIWSITLLIFVGGYVISFSLSSYLYTSGIISIGSVYLIIRYTDLLERPIEQIRVQLQDLQKAGASIMRVEELLSLTSNLKDGNEEIEKKQLSLSFRNVNFKYEDGKKVLENISFHLEAGQILGLLGRTGSGKTSLARLIMRLYDIESGEIVFNDQLIQNIKLVNLRKNIAYVTQDVQLFSASIRDNLTFYEPSINDETLLASIDYMGLTEWFQKLPNGLDTMIDSEGSSLSAGEAQLLSLVRVFLNDPQFIILDEASSRLDPITEQFIEKAINKLLIDKTVIIIAHRLKTIERANDIMILEEGNVIEYGKRQSLLNNKESRFYALLKTGIEEVLV